MKQDGNKSNCSSKAFAATATRSFLSAFFPSFVASSRGSRLYDKFIGVEKPYEIFKRIKEVSVDVKTDWNFPNAMRPEVNPWDQTKYDTK